MHHKRIRLPSVRSMVPGLKPGETAGPAGRRLHRRSDLKTKQMLQNSGKCCHGKGTEGSSVENNARTASSSWNDEKCGGWTLGYKSTTSGEEGGIRADLSQSEQGYARGYGAKTLPGSLSAAQATKPRGSSVDRQTSLFQHEYRICTTRISKSH